MIESKICFNQNDFFELKFENELFFNMNNQRPTGCKCTELIAVVRKNDIKEAKKYLYQVKLKNGSGWTALQIALKDLNTFSSGKMVELLLEGGADTNATCHTGWAPLHLAVRYLMSNNNMNTIKLLLQYGANINQKDDKGWSPLHHASGYSNGGSNNDAVKFLLQNGADINQKDNDGWTPLHLAAAYSGTDSLIETVELLLQNGADIECLNNDHQTALWLSLCYPDAHNSLDTAKLLLQHGAIVHSGYFGPLLKPLKDYPYLLPKINIDRINLLIQHSKSIMVDDKISIYEYNSTINIKKQILISLRGDHSSLFHRDYLPSDMFKLIIDNFWNIKYKI